MRIILNSGDELNLFTAVCCGNGAKNFHQIMNRSWNRLSVAGLPRFLFNPSTIGYNDFNAGSIFLKKFLTLPLKRLAVIQRRLIKYSVMFRSDYRNS